MAGMVKSLMHHAIQIAGVHDLAEALMLAEEGVTHIGFPLRLAYHQPDTSEGDAGVIIAGLPKQVEPVLITYLVNPVELVALAQGLGVQWVQIHSDITRAELGEARLLDPNLRIIKSLIVRPGAYELLERQIRELGDLVDAFITDTFDPGTGACGATGKTHDWTISRRLAADTAKPLILAGGLTATNVGEAIRAVRPAGVDAHTGLENERGRKEREKVRAFVQAARAAWTI